MNAIDSNGTMGNYLQSVFMLLDRVEYRRITTQSDFADIERLRKASYEGKNLVDHESFGAFFDDEDLAKDSYVIGVYLDEQLVSTIRIHVVTMEHQHGPSMKMFPDATLKLLQRGGPLIDPSRFATDPLALWKYPAIPLLTLRAAAMALDYFSAPMLVGSVREDGATFYKRCFGGEIVTPPGPVKGYTIRAMLLACPSEEIREKIDTRYPFFKSQPHERKLMFAPQDQLNYPSLNILPTAKYAHKMANNLTAGTYSEVLPV
jgi:hypothetical protein